MAMILALRAPESFPQPLSRFLFEHQPLWWIALGVLGGILILVARSRGNRRMRLGGITLLVATVLWLAAAMLVESSGERLRTTHSSLARAVQNGDVDVILTFFAPQFTVDALNINPHTADAKKEFKSRLDHAGIKETVFRAYHATLNSDRTAVSRFTALTLSDMGPILTTWEVQWEDVPGEDWKIHMAILRQIGD
jgi:hypothetical protein